jgi:hypothetical protein
MLTVTSGSRAGRERQGETCSEARIKPRRSVLRYEEPVNEG